MYSNFVDVPNSIATKPNRQMATSASQKLFEITEMPNSALTSLLQARRFCKRRNGLAAFE